MPEKRLFPLYPSGGYCVPKDFCIICQKMFIEVEPVGFVKARKGATRYYHVRCMKGGAYRVSKNLPNTY